MHATTHPPTESTTLWGLQLLSPLLQVRTVNLHRRKSMATRLSVRQMKHDNADVAQKGPRRIECTNEYQRFRAVKVCPLLAPLYGHNVPTYWHEQWTRSARMRALRYKRFEAGDRATQTAKDRRPDSLLHLLFPAPVAGHPASLGCNRAIQDNELTHTHTHTRETKKQSGVIPTSVPNAGRPRLL